jgi:uncharacterized protein (DUF927 family)
MPVVVCEGEKAADFASRVFPDYISTTSSGGSNAASTSDWTPLAGRPVLIWPDNDEAGKKYDREVTSILAELNCEISIIDDAALRAQVAPEREPGQGWDCADAVADSPDLNELRRAAVTTARQFDPGPAYVSFGPYEMTDEGLTAEVEGRAKNPEKVKVGVSAAFEVLGRCRDPHGRAWGKVLRWRDADGREHVQHIADAALQGDPATLCAILADPGLEIAPAYQRHLRAYLAAVRSRSRLTVVMHTGWHIVGGRSVFVLPSETIGPRGAEQVILDGVAHGSYETRGTIEDWRNGPAKLAGGHVLPRLAISAALAGTLLHLTGDEGGGLHFVGPSSIGKTTLLRLAASVWGRGDTPGYVRSWRATANALEGAAAGANDTVLVLDELGQIEAREMAAALYTLGNGAGKARAHRDGSLREPKTWRALTLSSGEVPIDVKMSEERGRKSRAGQLVRMIDLSAVRGSGVFDNAGPDDDAAALAKACKVAATTAYGTAGPDFVRGLTANDVTGDDVRAFVKDFVAAESPRGADGQIARVAQRIGLIAAAGELATEFGLTGWEPGEARSAAAWALKQWIEGRGGTEPAEVRQAVQTVRHFMEVYGEARFDGLDDPDAKPVINRAGWRKSTGEERRWLIPPEVWKMEVCAGLDAKFVARALVERGMLIRGDDGYSRVVKIAGTPKRVYVVTPRIFDGGDA